MTSEHEPAGTQPVGAPAQPPAASHPSGALEPQAEPGPRAFGPRFYAKLLAFLFVVGYSIAFIAGNDRTISVDFVFATASVSLIWTILLLLAVGLAGGALILLLYRHRRAHETRQK